MSKIKSKKVKINFSAFWQKIASWFALAKYNPHRAWEIIFESFILVAVLLLALSGYLFVKINSGEIFKVEKAPEGQLETINREDLTRVLHIYELKSLRFDSVKAGKQALPDPSI